MNAYVVCSSPVVQARHRYTTKRVLDLVYVCPPNCLQLVRNPHEEPNVWLSPYVLHIWDVNVKDPA